MLASTWPRFTLLGQSLGSVVLAYDAFSLLVPDIFIDTMGYAFSLALCSWFFPDVPTGAYVHYPTISTDMLDSLQAGGQGVNAGTGAGYRGQAKKKYWQLFAKLYSKVGSTIDVVMTNSTWTQSHIQQLWGSYRQQRNQLVNKDINVVFPPVAVEDVTAAVEISEASEKKRGPALLYIAQFRPEKNHQLILEAFASFLHSNPELKAYPNQTPKLVLIGSVRGSHDDAKRVYKLRLLAHELKIDKHTEFLCDAPWPLMLEWMASASVGVNGMWNEHFGIGCVEYQAAGLISVVNNSGGPKLDIVVEVDGKPTGTIQPPLHHQSIRTNNIQASTPRPQTSTPTASAKHSQCHRTTRSPCDTELASQPNASRTVAFRRDGLSIWRSWLLCRLTGRRRGSVVSFRWRIGGGKALRRRVFYDTIGFALGGVKALLGMRLIGVGDRNLCLGLSLSLTLPAVKFRFLFSHFSPANALTGCWCLYLTPIAALRSFFLHDTNLIRNIDNVHRKRSRVYPRYQEECRRGGPVHAITPEGTQSWSEETGEVSQR